MPRDDSPNPSEWSDEKLARAEVMMERRARHMRGRIPPFLVKQDEAVRHEVQRRARKEQP